MDVKDVRVLNARYLADKYGRDKLAEMLGKEDTNHLNQLVGGHGSFGRKVAAQFEEALNLGSLWMETPHPGLWGESEAEKQKYIDSICEGLSPADVPYFLTALARIVAK